MAERWLRVDDFVSKIESELRKPVDEQNQLLLAFWNSQLGKNLFPMMYAEERTNHITLTDGYQLLSARWS
jgi:hypothetical protein